MIMDYTKIFTRAIENKSKYEFRSVCRAINAFSNFHCGDWDNWADNYWYLLRPTIVVSYDKCYGYLCAEYPVALLTKHCPDELINFFDEFKILHTALEEPMSCNENILQQYVHDKMVFDECFVNNCDYSFDDERFKMVLHRLDTGQKCYVDSSCFTMKELR